MTTRTNIQASPTSPPLLGGLGISLGRLVNRWIASMIARSERQAARVALRQLDDRELKDIGVYRHQIDDACNVIARERMRLQRRRQSGAQ